VQGKEKTATTLPRTQVRVREDVQREGTNSGSQERLQTKGLGGFAKTVKKSRTDNGGGEVLWRGLKWRSGKGTQSTQRENRKKRRNMPALDGRGWKALALAKRKRGASKDRCPF